MPVSRVAAALPWIAAVVFVAATAGFTAALPGYSHLAHPLALAGADGLPRATVFNLSVFVLPGVLLAAAGLALRARLVEAGWATRIGATLALLSALAFAAQGVSPLDPEHLDSGESRFHATAWTLWWMAFAPGAALLAAAARPRWPHLAAAIGVPVLALVAPALVGGALAQRLAFAAWFGWWLFALRRPR